MNEKDNLKVRSLEVIAINNICLCLLNLGRFIEAENSA